MKPDASAGTAGHRRDPQLGVTRPCSGYLCCVKMTMPRAGWAPAAAAAVLLVGLAGCSAGSRGNPAGPSGLVDRFEAALKNGDAATACDLLAPPTRKELEQS